MDDIFRHNSPYAAFGYDSGALDNIINAANILQNAGYGDYFYRYAGREGFDKNGKPHTKAEPLIEAALQFFSCYVNSVGLNQTATAGNSAGCPDSAQVLGQEVNTGISTPEEYSSLLYPSAQIASASSAEMKSELASGSVDSIMLAMYANLISPAQSRNQTEAAAPISTNTVASNIKFSPNGKLSR